MPPAARVADMTGHSPPLSPGPGSVTVMIGFMPAWRALPSSMAGAVESVSNVMTSFMTTPVLTPANAVPKLVEIQAGLMQSAGAAAGAGNPAAVGAAGGATGTMISANVALTATWTAASVVPGGQPAANTAYTEGIKAAAAAAASAVFSAIGGIADMHICPILVPVPPHGPGMVTKGSSSVMIDNLPACRQGDKVFEAAGGADPIALGCQTVLIGDAGGGGGGGAGGGGAGAGGETTAAAGPAAQAAAEASAVEHAFTGAAHSGNALVERCGKPCGEV